MDITPDSTPTSDLETQVPTCARTDAKPQDRDVQMRYDIARNEDGPLRRTVNAKAKGNDRSEQNQDPSARVKLEVDEDDWITPKRFPALDERLRAIEKHLAVRYGMCFGNFFFFGHPP